MQEAVAAARGAVRAAGSMRVWGALTRSWVSVGGLIATVALPLTAAAAYLAATQLPRPFAGLLWLLWAWWWVPVMARGLAAAVSTRLIAQVRDEWVRVPDMGERPVPAAATFRRWLKWPLIGISGVIVGPALMAWAAEALSSPWSVVDGRLTTQGLQFLVSAVLCTGFAIRGALCTQFSAEMIDAALRPRWSWWPIVLLIAVVAGALQLALVEALWIGLSGAGLWMGALMGALGVAGTLLIGVATFGAVASAGLARLVSLFGARDPAAPSEPRAPFRRLVHTSRWPMWLAGGSVVLALVALLLAKQVAYTVLYLTEPRFATFVDGRRWSNVATQEGARTEMACIGNRFGVWLLDAAGMHDDAEDLSGLACAARNNDFEMARLLLKLGDDVNEPARYGVPGTPITPLLTPLAHAVEAERMVMVDWLATQGAKPDAAGPSGVSAIHMAAAKRCIACLAQLRSHGANLDIRWPVLPLVHWFDMGGANDRVDVETLARLAALGITPGAVGADGRSALHAAAAHAQAQAVGWLLANRADPDVLDRQGMTPLMHAAHGYGIPIDLAEDPINGSRRDQAERLEVVLTLLARTSTTSGTSSHMPERLLTPPVEPGWSLGMMAAREPLFRRAAREQGKHFDYGAAPRGTTPWQWLRPEVVRDTVHELTDDELRSGLWIRDGLSQVSVGLPFIAASQGWVPELRRMLELGLLSDGRSHSGRLCALLTVATLGHGDVSPTREASWGTTVLLLDAGLSPASCTAGEVRRMQDAVDTRTPVHRLQWQVRTANASTAH